MRQERDLEQEPLLFEASYEITVDNRAALFGFLGPRRFDRSVMIALLSFVLLRSFDRSDRVALFGSLAPRRFDGSLALASHQWSYLRVGCRRKRGCLLDLLPCGVQEG